MHFTQCQKREIAASTCSARWLQPADPMSSSYSGSFRSISWCCV